MPGTLAPTERRYGELTDRQRDALRATARKLSKAGRLQLLADIETQLRQHITEPPSEFLWPGSKRWRRAKTQEFRWAASPDAERRELGGERFWLEAVQVIRDVIGDPRTTATVRYASGDWPIRATCARPRPVGAARRGARRRRRRGRARRARAPAGDDPGPGEVEPGLAERGGRISNDRSVLDRDLGTRLDAKPGAEHIDVDGDARVLARRLAGRNSLDRTRPLLDQLRVLARDAR